MCEILSRCFQAIFLDRIVASWSQSSLVLCEHLPLKHTQQSQTCRVFCLNTSSRFWRRMSQRIRINRGLDSQSPWKVESLCLGSSWWEQQPELWILMSSKENIYIYLFLMQLKCNQATLQFIFHKPKSREEPHSTKTKHPYQLSMGHWNHFSQARKDVGI